MTMLVIHGFHIMPDEEIANNESLQERAELIDKGYFDDNQQEITDCWPFHDSILEPDFKDFWE